MTEQERRYVLRSDVVAWAACMGYLHHGGNHVAQYTLTTAVEMAISGELYALDGSHFRMPSDARMAWATTTFSPFMSAANQVFVVDEIVELIVTFCVDLIADMLQPHAIPGLPPYRWARQMSRIARVNSTFFKAASFWLWSYVPRFSCLSAIVTDIKFRQWRKLPSAVQWYQLQECINENTPHRRRLFCNLDFYLSRVEVLQIRGGEIETSCLPLIFNREPGAEVKPCPFPRLRSLYWTVGEVRNDIRNLIAFRSCPQLTKVVIDLRHAPPELDSYVDIHVLFREMRELFVHLNDVTLTTTAGFGRGWLPSSVLRLCDGLPTVAIKADVKQYHPSSTCDLYRQCSKPAPRTFTLTWTENTELLFILNNVVLSQVADFTLEFCSRQYGSFSGVTRVIVNSLTDTLTSLKIAGINLMYFEYAGSVLSLIKPAASCTALQTLVLAFPSLRFSLDHDELREICQTWKALRTLHIRCMLTTASRPLEMMKITHSIPAWSCLVSLHVPEIVTSSPGEATLHLCKTSLTALSCEALSLVHHPLEVAHVLSRAGITAAAYTTPGKEAERWKEIYKLGAWINAEEWDTIINWYEENWSTHGRYSTPSIIIKCLKRALPAVVAASLEDNPE